MNLDESMVKDLLCGKEVTLMTVSPDSDAIHRITKELRALNPEVLTDITTTTLPNIGEKVVGERMVIRLRLMNTVQKWPLSNLREIFERTVLTFSRS